ncbi:MAG: hypothetical protein WAW74_08970 [Trichococcus flocculiformis]
MESLTAFIRQLKEKTHISKVRGYFKCTQICVIIKKQAADPKGIQAAISKLQKRKDPPYGRHHI